MSSRGQINIQTSDSTNGINIGTTVTAPVTIGTPTSTTTIRGNLDVQGTTTTINTEQLLMEDNIITINSNQTGTPSNTLVSGIEIERGDELNYRFVFVSYFGQLSDIQGIHQLDLEKQSYLK